jgi:hypothetical protein
MLVLASEAPQAKGVMAHMTLIQRSLRPAVRRGSVAVLCTVLLTALIAVVAIAVDGGMLFSERRHAQATADAAAMAAACVLYEAYPQYLTTGTFPIKDARIAAHAVAKANGVNHTAPNTTVAVNVPPTSGPYMDASAFPGTVEVIVTYPQPRSFSNIFSTWNSAATGDLTVYARAVARGAWVAPNAGIIVLNYSGKATLDAQGNGSFTDVGAKIIVNSNNAAAAYDGGGGALRAPQYDITGGDAGKVSQFQNNAGVYDSSIIFTGVHPTPDPLAYLPVPGQPGAPPIPGPGSITSVPNIGNGTTYTLSPGTYGGLGGPNLPNFTNGDTIIFQQASVGNSGIYYLVSGGLTTNGANLTMDPESTGGIMFYNAGTGTSDGINIQGNANGTVNLSPLTSGIYTNMMFFQARNAPEDFQIAGNGVFNITGTFYVSDATLKVTGNGSTQMVGCQYISLDLSLSGNGNIGISYSPNLVTPMRVLTMTE